MSPHLIPVLGGSGQGHPQPYSAFKASLGYKQCQEQWLMLVNSTAGRLRQEDFKKIEASL